MDMCERYPWYYTTKWKDWRNKNLDDEYGHIKTYVSQSDSIIQQSTLYN